jgi:hypothetical protein
MRPSTKIRLKELGYRNYREYTFSTHWLERRALYFETHPKRCSVPWCRKRKGIVLHHVSYANLGAELDEDFLPLCAAHHRGLHTFMRHKRVKLEVSWPKYLAWLRERRERMAA